MKLDAFFGQLRLKPETARPGGKIVISSPKPTHFGEDVRASAQLRDQDGNVITEAMLGTVGKSLKGSLRVPPETDEGAYNVVVMTGSVGRLMATLLVLSDLTFKQLRAASTADRQKQKAYQMVRKKDYNKALELLSLAERRYQTAGWEHLQADTIVEKACLLTRANRYKDAERLLEIAVHKYNHAGIRNRDSRAFGKAWLCFEKARKLADQLHDRRNSTVNQNNTGEVLLYLRLLPKAQNHLVSALRGAKRLGDKKLQAIVRKNLAVCYVLERQFGMADAEFEEAATLFQEMGDLEKAEQVKQQRELARWISTGGAESMDVQMRPSEAIPYREERALREGVLPDRVWVAPTSRG